MWTMCVIIQNMKTPLHEKSNFSPRLQLNKDVYPTHSYLFSSFRTAVTSLPLMFLIKESELQELCFSLLAQ